MDDEVIERSYYSKCKSRHGVTLTDDAWAGVQAIADQLGVSSELLERIGRDQLVVVEPDVLAVFGH